MQFRVPGPTPMSGEGLGLRPRSLGELLDLSFRCYKKGFRTFAAIGIVVSLITGLSSVIIQHVGFSNLQFGNAGAEPELFFVDLLTLYAWIGISMVIAMTIYAVGMMAIVATTEDILLGRPFSARDAMSKSWKRAPSAIVTMFLVSMAVMAGAIMCFVPAIPLMISFALAIPLCYLERLGPFGAMGRSFRLAWKKEPRQSAEETNWVRILVVGFIVVVVTYALNLVASLPVMIVSFRHSFANLQSPDFGQQLLPLHIALPLQAFGSIVGGLFLAIAIVPWPLVYYDIRTRQEGLDLQLEADQIGTDASAPGEGTP